MSVPFYFRRFALHSTPSYFDLLSSTIAVPPPPPLSTHSPLRTSLPFSEKFRFSGTTVHRLRCLAVCCRQYHLQVCLFHLFSSSSLLRVEYLSHNILVLYIKTPCLALSKVGICSPISLCFICVLSVLARPSDNELSLPSCHSSFQSRAVVVSPAVLTRLRRSPHVSPQTSASCLATPTTALRLATDHSLATNDCYSPCYRRAFHTIVNRSGLPLVHTCSLGIAASSP